MNIIFYLLEKFFKEEKYKIILLLLVIFTVNIFQINGISFITAKIIEGVEHSNYNIVYKNLNNFILISTLFMIIYNVYRILQNNIITKLRNWVRKEILSLILIANNEYLNQTNFLNFTSPMHRIGAASFLLFSDFFSLILPNLTYIVVISLYFIYKNSFFGILFMIANIFIVFYFYFNWSDMMKLKKSSEEIVTKVESDILDLFNNMGKNNLSR